MTKRLIIVLGHTLAQDGSVQPMLASRLERALSIIEPEDTLLVCGKHAPKALVPERCEHKTEAQAMKQYLVERGVSADIILKEEQSATTFGNALFSLSIIEALPCTYQSIIVISNEFHGPLVRYCFDKVFGRDTYTFSAVPDSTLSVSSDEIEPWKNVINQLIDECYPVLFSDVKEGDFEAIKNVISGPRRTAFVSRVRALLHLDESADIVVASEAELVTGLEVEAQGLPVPK